jgi:DNA-binding FadR family transcriptional regulator
MVASRLRQRILTGDVPDGGLLPPQEQLLEEFGVSLASVREALRILETEGLVTVQRGKTGGAIVRLPTADKVAYMAALVLEARSVPVKDVARALQQLEPVCVGMCAARADRARKVLPELRRVTEESRASLDDPARYVGLARRFHEVLVAGCGSETLVLVVGALETLWSTHVDKLARRPSALGAFAARDVRDASLADHDRMVRLIADGDEAAAEQLARDHFSEPERHAFVGAGAGVQAALLTLD